MRWDVHMDYVADLACDGVVRLWDVSVLVDDGDDDEEDEENKEVGDGAGASSLPVRAHRGAAADDDSDDSDKSAESDDSGPPPKKLKGKNAPHRIQTDNEKFFQDGSTPQPSTGPPLWPRVPFRTGTPR